MLKMFFNRLIFIAYLYCTYVSYNNCLKGDIKQILITIMFMISVIIVWIEIDNEKKENK